MRSNCYNAEIIEPSFGFIGAVVDDEMIAAQGLVAHIESRSCVVSRSYGVAKNDIVLSVADTDDALTHIIVEVHINGLPPITRLNVRIAHVTIAQRAFDVGFVFVVNEVGRFEFLTRCRYQSEKQDCNS